MMADRGVRDHAWATIRVAVVADFDAAIDDRADDILRCPVGPRHAEVLAVAKRLAVELIPVAPVRVADDLAHRTTLARCPVTAPRVSRPSDPDARHHRVNVTTAKQVSDILHQCSLDHNNIETRPDGSFVVYVTRHSFDEATWAYDNLAKVAALLGTTNISFDWKAGWGGSEVTGGDPAEYSVTIAPNRPKDDD